MVSVVVCLLALFFFVLFSFSEIRVCFYVCVEIDLSILYLLKFPFTDLSRWFSKCGNLDVIDPIISKRVSL